MLIPSIDLMNNRAVQLENGDRLVLEQNDIDALADRFGRCGETAVIDLDAALGKGNNRPIVAGLCNRIPCRVGGGIRDVETAKQLVRAGAEQVIVGTAAISETGINRPFLQKLGAAIGTARIQVALDSRNNAVVTRGWKQETGLGVETVLKKLEGLCGGVLATFVEDEGCMTGLDTDRVCTLNDRSPVPVTVAGGVRSVADITAMTGIGVDVQVGMALYTGAIDLADGVIAGLNWQNGVVPTIACRPDGRVLMMAMSTPDSLKRTLETGDMWYWSRSRQELWHKGATSGNTQRLIGLRPDCDGDTLLATVAPAGPACHTGRDSCFGSLPFSIEQLQDIVTDRLAHPVDGSYTASLTASRMRQKLIEEAGEMALARDNDNLVAEAADLMYFLTVILAERDIPFADVIRELEARR